MKSALLELGPKIKSHCTSATLEKRVARAKLSGRLHALDMPIRRILGPDLAVHPQIEYLSGYIAFHGSAIETPHDIDISKVPVSYLSDSWWLGAEIVRIRNLHVLDDAWLMLQFPVKTKNGIQSIPCVSGQGMMGDYRDVQIYADYKWWSLSADHPVKQAEMAMTQWYALDYSRIELLTRVHAGYPKVYVKVTDVATGKSVSFFDYVGADLSKPFRGQDQWMEMVSWALRRGAKLRFEIKGPYADEEFAELRKLFLRLHGWHL